MVVRLAGGLYTDPMSEAKAQEKLLDGLKKTGAETQKFTDMFGFGIPDLVAGITGFAIWVEMKYREAWPVKPTTPLLTKSDITGNQVNWARSWWMKPSPTSVLLALGDGSWLLVPGLYASRLTEMPSRAWTPVLQTTPLGRQSVHSLLKVLHLTEKHLKEYDHGRAREAQV